MSISSITTSILSSLGNNTGSVIPIAAKDLIQNQIIVAQYHKDGGEHDAFEKFVEENGTSVIWLGGLPFIKKIFDKTVYKMAGISPDVDIKKLKDNAADSVDFALQKLKEQGKAGGEQYKLLSAVKNNKSLSKGLFVGKFVTATAMTLAALAGIILLKQKSTEDKVKQKVALEVFERSSLKKNVESSGVAQMFKTQFEGNNADSKDNNDKNEQKDISFKGGNPLSAFMYNPVLNQFLLDLGITTVRTKSAREGEKRDVLVKEAFEIAFLYPLAAPIQKGFDFLYGKLFGKNTGLDYGVLASERFEKSLADSSLKEALKQFGKDFDIEKFGSDFSTDRKLLNFIYDNPDNPIVKFLKDTGDVQTVKENAGKKFFGLLNAKKATDEIDSLAHIDTKNIAKSIKKLSKTVNSMDANGAIGNVEKVGKYLKGAKWAKGLSIVSAIAFGIWAIGVVQTKVVLKLRKDETGSTENKAITNLENKLRHQMTFEGIV